MYDSQEEILACSRDCDMNKIEDLILEYKNKKQTKESKK